MTDATCPLPARTYDRVVMAHGGGGRLSADLLRRVFLPAFGNDVLSRLEDQATLPWEGGRLAFTTDAFVVKPFRPSRVLEAVQRVLG